MDFEFFFRQLKIGKYIDETCFYFKGESEKDAHMLGYLPQYDKPYWVGYCDIIDGCEFNSAEELVDAKIFGGKSLRERWEDVVICSIMDIPVEDWLSMLRKHE